MFDHSAHLGCYLVFSVAVTKLSAVPGIGSVHELHIWELASGKIIATLHIKYQKDRDYQDASRKIREIFHGAGIHSVTIQFEAMDLKESLEQKDLLLLCNSPCISKSCAKKLCCPPGALPLAHVNGCAEQNGGHFPEIYRSRRDGAEVAVDMALDGYQSNYGHTPNMMRENHIYENSTHF